MKKCSYCGEEIENNILKCNFCGKVLEKESQRTDNIIILYFFGVILSIVGTFIGNIFGFILSLSIIFSIWLHPRKGEKYLENRFKQYKNYKFRIFISIILGIFFILFWLGNGFTNAKIKDELDKIPTPTIIILNKDFSGSIIHNNKTNNTNTGFLLNFKVLNAENITLNSKTLDFNSGGIYQENIELLKPITNINILAKNKYKETSYNFNIERNSTESEKKQNELNEKLKKEQAEQEKIRLEKEEAEIKAEEEKRAYEERIAKNWKYSEEKDKMTDSINKFASSTATNTLYFDFPYQGGSYSVLTVRKMDGKLDIILYVNPSQINGDYNNPTIKARFDNNKAMTFSYLEPADHSSDTIFIISEYKFLENLKKSKKLILEVGFYQEGVKTIEFDVEGLKW